DNLLFREPLTLHLVRPPSGPDSNRDWRKIRGSGHKPTTGGRAGPGRSAPLWHAGREARAIGALRREEPRDGQRGAQRRRKFRTIASADRTQRRLRRWRE